MFENVVITICGAGTLGGNLVENLARIGLKNLHVIDCDRVEQKNLANQPYATHDIGQLKVKALSEMLYRAVGARVTGISKKLNTGNALRLLGNSDLVIDVFDNSVSRRAVTDICGWHRIPCLHAGLGSDGYGEIIWNEQYKVPPDQGDDACEKPLNRNLSLLVIAIVTEAIVTFLRTGEKKNYSITMKDLSINSLLPLQF